MILYILHKVLVKNEKDVLIFTSSKSYFDFLNNLTKHQAQINKELKPLLFYQAELVEVGGVKYLDCTPDVPVKPPSIIEITESEARLINLEMIIGKLFKSYKLDFKEVMDNLLAMDSIENLMTRDDFSDLLERVLLEKWIGKLSCLK